MKPILYASLGSHHSRRVVVLIHELGLDVDIKPVDVRPPGMGGDNAKPDFLALNPNGKVPVLRDGELVLWESNAIMGYLADTHGETPLWPREPARRAEIAKWHFWQAAHLSPAADGLLYERLVKPMRKQPSDPASVASLTESFRRWMGVMEGTLAKTPYLAGSAFTTADICVAAALMYAPVAQLPIEDYANVVAWRARVHARPSWKASEPPPMRAPRQP
jgi:glutathione S-transferase